MRFPALLAAGVALTAGACMLNAAGTGPAGDAGSGGATTTTTTGPTGDAGAGGEVGAGGAGGEVGAGGKGGAGGSPPGVECGDGVIHAPETCDDGNTDANDGCSADCAIEPGFECSGAPSVCTEIPPIVVAENPGNDVIGGADAYDGSLTSMGCVDVVIGPTPYTSIQRVELEIALDCVFIGDVVIKLVHPGTQVTTVLSRPGYDEPADDGESNAGDSSNFVRSSPIRFYNGAPNDAEQMGNLLIDQAEVCEDDNRCDYNPNHGAGPGTNLADFNGLDPEGTWRVCAGDSAGGLGVTVDAVELTVLAW